MLNWFSANYDPRALFWAWGAIALSMIAIHLFERIFPAQKSQSYRSLGFNAGVTLAYLALVPIEHSRPATLSRPRCRRRTGRGSPWILLAIVGHTEGWQRAALLALFAFVPILTFDFFYYWFHRLQHASPWLGEQHKLHHTDEAVNVTTSLRHHWTEEGFRSILIAVPMGIVQYHPGRSRHRDHVHRSMGLPDPREHQASARAVLYCPARPAGDIAFIT